MYIGENYLEEMFQMNSIKGFYEFYPKDEYQKIFHGIKHLYDEGKYRLLAKQLGVLFEPTLNYLIDYGKARTPFLTQLIKSEISDEILAHLAVAMILDSYEEDRLVVHGDAEVIENLNYFEFHELDDRENVRAYFEFVELPLATGIKTDIYQNEFNSFSSITSAEEFEQKLDDLADKIEIAGKLGEYEDKLTKLADRLTELMIREHEQNYNKHFDGNSKVLWQWADKFNIPYNVLPRNRDGLMGLTELEIISKGLIAPLNDVSELVEVLEEEKDAFYLPIELFELTELTKLEVYGMGLTYLPDEIEKLEKLTELKLTLNQLEMIPSSVGNLKNLTTLDLSINWLEEIPITLAKLKNLKYLDVSSELLTITSSQEDWLYELADNGCEVIWDKENTTVIGEDDEYDEEQSTRDFIESLGGEEALVGMLKGMGTKKD